MVVHTMALALVWPWRHPKTGTYWFRRRVPKELLLLVGRSQERKSMKRALRGYRL